MTRAPHERIIFAIDVDRVDEALVLALEIQDAVGLFKVGLQMLANSGTSVFAQVLAKNSKAKFFYDAKFHDIPMTVAAACKNSAELPGIEYVSVHASAGPDALEAAVKSAPNVGIVAITALTSLSDADCVSIYGQDRQKTVTRFAETAKECGLSGVVCSPLELSMLPNHLKSKSGNDFLTVVPGIRPDWARTEDQKATATPYEAIRDGADLLVIGRPIRTPPEAIGRPLAAVHAIATEIERGLLARSA